MERFPIGRGWVGVAVGLALVVAGGARSLAAQAVGQAGGGALLGPERIAGLPPGEREAWRNYLETSRRRREEDRKVLAAEVKAEGLEAPRAAPSSPGFFLQPHMTDEWFRTEEARRVADAIVSFQTPTGGWSKRVALERPRRRGESWASEGNQTWIGTFDNGATTEQMRFLARVVRAQDDPRYRAAFLKGLEYILEAQYPNGCWPQIYPLAGSYHDAVTFNDDAMVNILRVLEEVARGEVAFVPEAARRRARSSLERGVECILAAQVVVDGRRTVWGAQHDPLTLVPVKARAYEPASLSGRESARIVDFLMSLETADPRVAQAVRGAVQWFRETALYGYDYTMAEGRRARPGAGPLWARFYEIGTNRPIFGNRQGEVLYDYEQVDEERKAHYAWYTDEPTGTLRRYEAWARRQARVAERPGGGQRLEARAARRAGAYHAIVDARYTGPEGAEVDGARMYRSIGRALEDVPQTNTEPYLIFIRKGRYYEKLSIEKPNVHLIGESRDSTILTYDAAAGKRSPGGWPYGTRGSFTMRVAAPDFQAENLTIENGFDYPANAAKAANDPTKVDGAQAVAVMIDEGGDRVVFRKVRISGYQDTLFPNAGRSYFRECIILGHVDFIFGAGRAVFEDCDIISRDRGSATNNGYVTAPSTPKSQPYGFVFINSRLRKETPAMAPNSVVLGRPWHPSGDPAAIGSAVFIDCWMDDHIGAKGWDGMNSRDAAGHQVWNRPEDARFFEYGTKGPGAVRSPSRRWLTAEEAQEYTVTKVLDGWDPGAVRSTAVWSPDLGDGTYRNPIIFADYSDPDVIRVGDDFYMTASSFGNFPALPILHSKDLVNWRIVNYAIERFPDAAFDEPQHGNGVWAPALRYRDGEFRIYYGDPDRGIYMVKTRDILGKWDPPVLVKEAKGWIDPCPLWDDDGTVYLVHAFANSRAGVKSILHVNRLSPDGTRVVDEGVLVFDGRETQPTIEGPKFYKRNGYYYIFAPAGGVRTGWQTVLRSRNIYGPYEAKIVLAQGRTEINGPHQGGYVELENGEGWFIHFQDRGPYGRITHLQPVVWKDDWPVIGEDPDGDGTGEPVRVFRKPNVGASHPPAVPQASDDFEAAELGLQWQWAANFRESWFSLTERRGSLRLYSQALPDTAVNLWPVPNLLLQKLPAPAFEATTRVSFRGQAEGEMAGLVVFGLDYGHISVRRTRNGGTEVVQGRVKDADKKNAETVERVSVPSSEVWLRVRVQEGARCQFLYSVDGERFVPLGEPFQAREGKWVGAKVGLFAVRPSSSPAGGYADFDFFRIDPLEDAKAR